jgi:hypothetical protein
MNEAAKHQNARERSRRRIKIATYIILAVAALLAVYLYIQSIPPPPGMYDAFAKCIAQSGAKFYGAFWCPHCAAQKQEFGSSEQYLPYVECSLPDDESAQTQICIDKNIGSYPTWVFPDGSRLTGTTPLATLAQKTGCALPDSAGSANPADSISLTGSTGTSTQAGSSSPAL